MTVFGGVLTHNVSTAQTANRQVVDCGTDAAANLLPRLEYPGQT
jgi:hypothetical protein